MTRCASTARPLTIDGRDGGGASPVPSLLSDGGGDDNFASILGSYLPSGRESRDGAALGVRTVVVPPVAGEGGAPVLMVGVEGRDLPASVLSVTARPGPLVVASASSAVARFRDGAVTGSAFLPSIWPGRGSTPQGVSTATLLLLLLLLLSRAADSARKSPWRIPNR